jgi:hypothetical protein
VKTIRQKLKRFKGTLQQEDEASTDSELYQTVKKMRAEGGAEEDRAEKVITMALGGSRKKTPAFALACRKQVWEPVSQTRSSVMHDVVQEQWQAYLRDPGLSLLVNTI